MNRQANCERGPLSRFVVLRSGNFIDSAIVSDKGHYPVYGANGQIGWTDCNNYSGVEVVVGRVGSCGAITVVEEPAWITDNTIVLEPSESVDPVYLAYALRVKDLRSLASSSIQPLLTQRVLAAIEVCIPPLSEQKRIAARLDEQMVTLAGAQAALAAQRGAATALRSAVLRTTLDPATHPAWPAVQLSQICTIVMGQSPPGDTYATSPVGLPFFQGKVDFGAFSPAARVWCVSPIKIAEKGDILLCVRAPVGPTNVANERCCIGRGLAALRPSTKLLPAFLLWWLKYVEPQISSLGEGSTFSAIGKSELQNLRIQLPALSEQRRIAEHLDSSIKEVDAVVASLDSQASTLDVLRTSLLDAAFSGQV